LALLPLLALLLLLASLPLLALALLPLLALLPPLFTDGPAFCACPADKTSKEASNPMPRSLPYRATGIFGDTSRLPDILLLPHTASTGRCGPKERHVFHSMQFSGPQYIPKA